MCVIFKQNSWQAQQQHDTKHNKHASGRKDTVLTSGIGTLGAGAAMLAAAVAAAPTPTGE